MAQLNIQEIKDKVIALEALKEQCYNAEVSDSQRKKNAKEAMK